MRWHQILPLVCFHLYLHSSLQFALPLCPPDQHDTLLHFKNSFMLDSKSYPKTNSLYKGMDCYSWDGVTCDGAACNVIGLNLTCSNITNLVFINLSNNKLQGPLPRSLVKWANLSTLVLSHNEFSDIFPHWLEALANFASTSCHIIASNNITRKIPSLICNATWLKIIDLSNNSLTGSLPQCLTNFSTYLSGLMTLDLSQNRFEGTLPQSLVKCRYLEETFPRWLGTLLELKVLVLRSTNLKDLLDIPTGAHLFPKLHILDLPNNSFSSPLPANLIMKLKGMMNDENFDLSLNKFSGLIPQKLGDLASTGYLNLSKNQLIGRIPQDKQLSTFSSHLFSGNSGYVELPCQKHALAMLDLLHHCPS
ncbi:hypothetical protein EUGRSUZ_F00678 [Eucalyptus grandis]|uniref:Uncharacterized protein n=2 Tax=Eucalyptus grandis TaxID=71139 RepID=A0ACC3KCS7_EUCGR|nr:hypothetical protein EUGRSUZ_F00678 [Eucalyptus grandis]